MIDRRAPWGWRIAPFDFDPGPAPHDRSVDLPPYPKEPRLRLTLEDYATPSIGVIIRKPA